MAAEAVTGEAAAMEGTAMARNNPRIFRVCTFVSWLALVLSGGPGALAGDLNSQPKSVPAGPLELASGPLQFVNNQMDRKAVLDDLGRVRQSFALRTAGHAYDIKVSFQANSNGETNYDGAWTMEETFAPDLGLRWTAHGPSGYSITRISSQRGIFQEGGESVIPLRLQEVRGILFDPVQSPSYARRGTIRRVSSRFRGAAVTCVLLSGSNIQSHAASGRDWDETEECFDPVTALLRMHSEVPGRYVVYDYPNVPQLGDLALPKTVTVSEGGRVVTTISVDSAELLASSDPGLFVPTNAMVARGTPTAIGTATKMVRVAGNAPVTSGTALNPICVFGVLSPAGRLVEAHSLQPGDPNSQAAVADAQSINFSPGIAAGAAPRQHFVFVIEEFPARQ
jgi:hypothetical protein